MVEKKGWSQFAFEAGKHRTYINGIERGVRNPTITFLERIATSLDVDPTRPLEVSGS